MEKFPLNQREAPTSRIVGVSPEDEASFLDFIKNKFRSKRLPANFEKKRTKEVDNLIVDLNNNLGNFLAHYGIMSVNIPPANIHILDRSKLPPGAPGSLGHKGFYDPTRQQIGITIDLGKKDRLDFAKTLVHEMLHVNSFQSFERTPNNEGDGAIVIQRGNGEAGKISLNTRRMGLGIRARYGGRNNYFRDLDEAVIETMTKLFFREYGSGMRQIKEEYDKLQSILAEKKKIAAEKPPAERSRLEKVWNDIARIDGNDPNRFLSYGYPREREKMEQLVNELYEKNRDSFSSPGEVFNLLVQAVFAGKLLPLARLIEKTYGKGSFRRLGKMTNDNKK